MIVDQRTSQQLAAATRFGDIRELAQVDSTNRYLLDLARQGAPEGVVVVADHQTRGRGRLGRSWEAPPGSALLVSILLRPDEGVLVPGRRWLVPAAVALAAADACRPRLAEIKWPNDLLLGGAKLAGILAEADVGPDAGAGAGGGGGAGGSSGPAGAGPAPGPGAGVDGGKGAVVVGIGINVSSAPPGAAFLGPSVDRGRLLAALLGHLEGWCDRWDDVSAAYRRRCATIGRQVRVELGGDGGVARAPGRAARAEGAAGAGSGAGRVVVGRAEAVEADGRLRVVSPEGTFSFSAGDVTHLRPGAQLL